MNINILGLVPEEHRAAFLERLQAVSEAKAEAQAEAARLQNENAQLRQRLRDAEGASHGAAKYEAQLIKYQRQDVLRTLMSGVTDSEFKEIQSALGKLQGSGVKHLQDEGKDDLRVDINKFARNVKISTGSAYQLLAALFEYNGLNPVFKDGHYLEGWASLPRSNNIENIERIPIIRGKGKLTIIDDSPAVSSSQDLGKLLLSISDKESDQVVAALSKLHKNPKKYLIEGKTVLPSDDTAGTRFSISNFTKALGVPEPIAFKVLAILITYNDKHVAIKGDHVLGIDRTDMQRQETAEMQLDIPRIETTKDKTIKLDGTEFKTAAQQHGDVHSKLSGLSKVKEKLTPPAFLLAGVLLSASTGIDKEAISHTTEMLGHLWEQTTEHLPEIHVSELLEKAMALLPDHD